MPREKLADIRKGKTHSGIIYVDGTRDEVKIHITMNTYVDGRPAELFVKTDQYKIADSWAIAVSLYLQGGGDIKTVVRHFAYQNFAPFGRTDNPHVGYARSIVDYVARWIDWEYGGRVTFGNDVAKESEAKDG